MTYNKSKPVEISIPITILSPLSVLESLPRLDFLAAPTEDEIASVPTIATSMEFVESRPNSPEALPSTSTLNVEEIIPIAAVPPPAMAINRSATLQVRKMAPLKSFASRSSTIRAKTTQKPPILAPSPASLKALGLEIPASPAASEVANPAESVAIPNYLDFEVTRTDLDLELDS